MRRARAANWAHIITVTGTALAAIAAIGGLWAQAVTSYWSQQTARDQLLQSRKDAERESRSQAARVSYWQDKTTDGMTRLHVMNRSPDPLTCTHVAFRAVNLAPDGHQVTDAAEFDAEMLSIAPCTEVIYSTDRMRISGERSDDRDERFDFRRMEISNIAIVFVDRDGVRWMRNVGGLKPIGWKTRPAIPRLSGTPTIHLTDGLPSVKRIAECGSTY